MLAVSSLPAEPFLFLFLCIVRNCKIWYALWCEFMGALFYHADEGKPMSSTRRDGRYFAIGQYMVTGWMWLATFGVESMYSTVGDFLQKCHGAQLRAHRLFRSWCLKHARTRAGRAATQKHGNLWKNLAWLCSSLSGFGWAIAWRFFSIC